MTRSSSEPGLTADDLEFRFLAGRVSLAFTATLGERWRRGFERLRAPADLGRWFAEAGVLDSRVAVGDEDLELARQLREAIHRSAAALTRGHEPPARDIRLINCFARAPTPAPQLRGDTVARVADEPALAALSALARDAIDLFAGPWAERIRECESEECALLFVDTSRPGRRRWCSSETCGSRERSAAYRARRG